MDLVTLGWDPILAEHFETYRRRGLVPARIAREERERYLTYGAEGELTCEITGRARHRVEERGGFPAVGDWVALELWPQGSGATVRGLLPRKSKFSRKVKGRTTEEQVVAANIDTVFLVTGLDRDYNVSRIERYLTLAWDSGARPVILLNKADLCSEVEERVAEVEAVALGVPVHAVCAREAEGLTSLHQYVTAGQTAALLGSSGVGKSTIINTLLGTERQAVGATRESDGRGRHTTSQRELILLPQGGLLIDNPGMREIQLWGDQEALRDSFADVEELALQCRFRSCRHEQEPDCAVQEALAEGRLDSRRYRSYLRLRRELAHLELRKDQRARLTEKNRWKKIAISIKKMKEMEKHRG